MGITGLLPFLEQATRNCNISEFRGATVAIDTYCWLHKGATACADILARGEETDIYVNFCMKYVNMLLKYDIKPILVFDGNRLPAKEITEKRRRESRKNAKVRAAELLRLECRRNNVDCIVAPYESDAELAYLNLKGIADVVITEDSDLVLFGCTAVFFKMDVNGNGRLVEKEKLPLCMNMKPDQYTFDKFRYMCILSGCDYLDSLSGVGLKKALKFVSLTAETDPLKFLEKVPRYLNLKNRSVTEEYKDNFMVADATFRHQIVYDPITRKLTYLTDPGISGTRPEYCRNAGKIFDENLAYQVALGNVDPSTHEKYDDWSPTKHWKNNLHSIWSNVYVKKISRKAKKELDKLEILEIERQKEKELNEYNIKRKLNAEAQSSEFESQLSIYYHKNSTNQLTHSVQEIVSDIKEENKDLIDKNSFDNKKSTSNEKSDGTKEVSPVLNKNKFIPTETTEKNVIVKSKYFHTKSEDVDEKPSAEVLTPGNGKIDEFEYENLNFKKRKVESEEPDEYSNSFTNNSPEVKLEEDILDERSSFLSQQPIKPAKKPKLTRCRSVGLPLKSGKKQLTLQVFFGNAKKS
ncbi:hypothetical protein HHI36_013937 [Cryptolaemus montrouzieri]|uniref:Exonuclease 1 n=1 Tax=Cryptolaemus montrouzieri TaxID=559131 RepID=A0ABD2N207_9CUCU